MSRTGRKIATVALIVRDYDEAIDWFCTRLSFDLVEDTPQDGNKRWVVVSPGNRSCRLLLAEPVGEQQRSAIGNQTGGRVGFFLETDDFQRDYNSMRSKGVEFHEAPRFEPYGTVAVFSDLWGNKWDLIEPNS